MTARVRAARRALSMYRAAFDLQLNTRDITRFCILLLPYAAV